MRVEIKMWIQSIFILLGLTVNMISSFNTPKIQKFTPQNYVKPWETLTPEQGGEMFEYISRPDSSFEYYDTGVILNRDRWWGKWVGYVLNVTSQTWRSPDEVSISKWTHQLAVIVPDHLRIRDQALLYLTGGDNVPESALEESREDIILASTMATRTGSITAAMFQIPNQPIVFHTDPIQKQRHEDAVVGYTWLEFFRNTSRAEVLSLLPMTKAGVRGMDTLQHFCDQKGWTSLSQFVVAGASKRGWTTWMVGAVDTRVKAIIPVVMDLLHIQQNLIRHYQSLGGWSFAFSDYFELGLTGYINTPLMSRLGQVIDVATYLPFLDIPKLVIGTTGDEFFLLDDDSLWWNELKTPLKTPVNKNQTWRLLIPNAEHTLDTGILTVIEGVSGFYDAILKNAKIPQMEWKTGSTSLTLHLEQKPSYVWLRQAQTQSNRRDFRLVVSPQNCSFLKVEEYCLQPVLWDLEILSNDLEQHVEIKSKKNKYSAALIEVRFPGEEWDFIFTTQAVITPNEYPFDPPQGGDLGNLV
jgi:PhoPQ-activated pathogenicity-related protein